MLDMVDRQPSGQIKCFRVPKPSRLKRNQKRHLILLTEGGKNCLYNGDENELSVEA